MQKDCSRRKTCQCRNELSCGAWLDQNHPRRGVEALRCSPHPRLLVKLRRLCNLTPFLHALASRTSPLPFLLSNAEFQSRGLIIEHYLTWSSPSKQLLTLVMDRGIAVRRHDDSVERQGNVPQRHLQGLGETAIRLHQSLSCRKRAIECEASAAERLATSN